MVGFGAHVKRLMGCAVAGAVFWGIPFAVLMSFACATDIKTRDDLHRLFLISAIGGMVFGVLGFVLIAMVLRCTVQLRSKGEEVRAQACKNRRYPSLLALLGGLPILLLVVLGIDMLLGQDHAGVLEKTAFKCLSDGEPDEAISTARSIIRYQPFNPMPYTIMGEAWLAKGDFEKAEHCFSKMIRLSESSARGHVLRAEARQGLGKNNLARDDLNKAVQMADGPEAFEARAALAWSEARFAEALSDVRALESYRYARDSARLKMARFLATCPDRGFRDPGRAVSLAESVIRDGRWHHDSTMTLALAYASAGELTSATMLLKTDVSVGFPASCPRKEVLQNLFQAGKAYVGSTSETQWLHRSARSRIEDMQRL